MLIVVRSSLPTDRSGPKQSIAWTVWHVSCLAANCSIVYEIKKKGGKQGEEAWVQGTLPLCVSQHKRV